MQAWCQHGQWPSPATSAPAQVGVLVESDLGILGHLLLGLQRSDQHTAAVSAGMRGLQSRRAARSHIRRQPWAACAGCIRELDAVSIPVNSSWMQGPLPQQYALLSAAPPPHLDLLYRIVVG